MLHSKTIPGASALERLINAYMRLPVEKRCLLAYYADGYAEGVEAARGKEEVKNNEQHANL